MKKIILFFIFIIGNGYFHLAFSQDATWIEDVTSKVGLDSAHASYVYVADLNNDHYPDIIVVETNGVNKGHLRFYLNVLRDGATSPKDRYFKDVTEWSNIDIRRNGEHGRVADVAAFADFNNDGFLDCISCIYYHRWEYYHPDSLDPGDRCEALLNNGNGQFTLKQNSNLPELGLTNASGMTMFDYQNDGNIDVFIPQWFKDYANNTMMPAIMLKGNGDGSFTDVSQQTGISSSDFPLYGANATDWNNDGWIDIATCPYCRNGGSLWKNNGDGTFTDVASQVGYNTQVYNGDGWGDVAMTYPKALCTWAAQPQDFDNDGDIDFLFVQVHGGFGNDVYGKPAGRSTIVVNQGKDSNYKLKMDLSRLDRKPPRSSHLGDYDASWFDIDNDMYVDLAIGNGSYTTNTRLYIIQQQKDHSFIDISKALNIGGSFSMIQEVYSMESIDFDLDGDDDLLITHGDGSTGPKNSLMLIENKIGQNNKWIGILLNAPSNVNRSSIGARITVYSGGVAQMKEIKAGFGHFGGQQPFITNFGLANNTKIDSITIRWPSNPIKYTKVYDAHINSINIIDENGNAGLLDIKGNYPNAELRLYPNPATDHINIQIPKGFGSKGSYRIMDISGKTLFSGQYNADEFMIFSLGLNNSNSGYYFANLQSEEGFEKTIPFLVK